MTKTEGLSEEERRHSRLPSGWTPRELVKHLTFVELRWLEWGFEGRQVLEPWGDQRGDRWYVGTDETTVGGHEKLPGDGHEAARWRT